AIEARALEAGIQGRRRLRIDGEAVDREPSEARVLRDPRQRTVDRLEAPAPGSGDVQHAGRGGVDHDRGRHQVGESVVARCPVAAAVGALEDALTRGDVFPEVRRRVGHRGVDDVWIAGVDGQRPHESGSAPQLPVVDGGRGGRAYGTCSHERERRECTHGIPPLSLRDGSSIAYDRRTFAVKKNRQESAAVLWRTETKLAGVTPAGRAQPSKVPGTTAKHS